MILMRENYVYVLEDKNLTNCPKKMEFQYETYEECLQGKSPVPSL